MSAPENLPLVGGNFNLVTEPLEDRSPSPRTVSMGKSAPTLLSQIFTFLYFSDVWHLSNPTEKAYTFYSAPHDSFSQIDDLFSLSSLLPMLGNLDVSYLAISNNSPILVNIGDLSPCTSSDVWRFLSYLTNNDDFMHMLHAAWSEYLQTNGAHLSDPNLFWEAGRGLFKRQNHFFHNTI